MMQPIKNSNECYWSTAVLLVSANTGFFMQICRKTCMSKTLSTKHPCNISLLHYHSHIASTLPNMAEATDSSYLFIKKYTCKSGYHCVPPIAGEIVITMQLRCQQNNKNKHRKSQLKFANVNYRQPLTMKIIDSISNCY